MDVMINKTEIQVPAEVATWGDLLDWIETDYLQAGQCITHVFIDGNEAYDYRVKAMSARELNTVETVEVHSGDFDKVVKESLEALELELKNAVAKAGDIVRLLENRSEREAYGQLDQLLDSMPLFFSLFSQDLAWAEDDAEISCKESSAVLERALSEMITAQENQHWVSVCDVLEYEITPILESWQSLAARTREHIN